MGECTTDNVIIETRFSRLRPQSTPADSAPRPDLSYEALALLSEAMELLHAALSGPASVLDLKRLDRVKQRLTLLSAWGAAPQVCAPTSPIDNSTETPERLS